MVTTRIKSQDTFQAVLQGLQLTPKQLPSFLFYDSEGDRIFREIMRMPEYYLTDCEHEILSNQSALMAEHFTVEDTPFDLIELGAGDGTKTELLLRTLVAKGIDFKYVPVDVSKHVLQLLSDRLRKNLPALTVEPVHGRIEHIHESLNSAARKVFLYLGANIGNFSFLQAQTFLQSVAGTMDDRDLLMIGFDLKKDPRQIIAAYDDSAGVTARFNRNLLQRLNREFGADFDPDKFDHFPTYDPESGITKSFLVSREEQQVRFRDLGITIDFRAWETIHTEVSVKYDMNDIASLASGTGLEIVDSFTDRKGWFSDVLFARSGG